MLTSVSPSSGVLQQRQTVAPGDRPLRQRERQQTASRQQVWPHDKEGGGLHHSEGERPSEQETVIEDQLSEQVCAGSLPFLSLSYFHSLSSLKHFPGFYSLGYFVQKNVLLENPDKQKLVGHYRVQRWSQRSVSVPLTHSLTGFGEMRVSVTVGKDDLNNFIDVQKTELHFKKKFRLYLACFSVSLVGKAGELICFYIWH